MFICVFYKLAAVKPAMLSCCSFRSESDRKSCCCWLEAFLEYIWLILSCSMYHDMLCLTKTNICFLEHRVHLEMTVVMFWCISRSVTLAVVLRLFHSLPGVLMTLAQCQSSVDEDVPGPASAPFLDLRPDLPHHAGPQARLQDPLELVPHLPPCLDFWHHPHPHAGGEDGGSLQAGLWPQGWWAESEAEVVVLDSPVAETGLLSDSMLTPREAHRNVGQLGVCPSVGAAGWGTGGAGTQCFPLQEGLNQNTVQYTGWNVWKGTSRFWYLSFSHYRCTNLSHWIGIRADIDLTERTEYRPHLTIHTSLFVSVIITLITVTALS